MLSRRDFLKAAAVAGSAGYSKTVHSLTSRRQDSSGFFGVHPFIENHPEAVFIIKTNVDRKDNSEAKYQAGFDLARSVIVPRSEEDGGVPISNLIPVKPNLTCRGKWDSKWTEEDTKGVVSDADFVEGIIDGMKELGIDGSQFFIREVNCPEDFEIDGFGDPFNNGEGGVAGRTGAELRDMTDEIGVINEEDVVWSDVPGGYYFSKIPHLAPVNAPDTWLLNIAKLKAHGMGVTQSVKNLQGTVVHNYQRFGSGYRWIDMEPEHQNPNGFMDIITSYRKNKEVIPRWDKSGQSFDSGLGMETWAHMSVDNHSVLKTGLNIVEAIFSRDGNGFVRGPGENGLSQEFLTNFIILGMNPFYVDNIGHWLAAHEPGNFGLFHIAQQRGMIDTFNPHEIPVYEWMPDGTAVQTPLEEFERTPLVTYYLRRNYKGQTEDEYHLCDEPFDYPSISVKDKITEPKAIVLNQNFPNPFNPFTSIEYAIPGDGNVQLEIYNAAGQVVDVLVNGYQRSGSHMAVWNTNNYSSGVYFYRLSFGSYSELKKMTLLK